jgi:PAS domain S-box-containing protein
MTAATDRFAPELCARAFMRTAQYMASMLPGAEVLIEARSLIRAAFAADTVIFLSGDRGLGEVAPEARATIAAAARQVLDSGFMAMESTQSPNPAVWILLPVTVRGQIEAAMLVGYGSAVEPPPHLLESLLGVAAIVGSALARQLSDRELRDTVTRTRLILEAVGEGVCGVDATGIITFANQAALRIIGCGESDLVGHPAEMLIVTGGQFAAGPDEAMRRREFTLLRRNGTPFPADVVCVPFVLEGKPAGLVATFADISERKEAEEQLRHTIDQLARSNGELERFAYVASHDLQEPVRTVVSFGQLLERSMGERLEQNSRDYLTFITQGARRMGDLVRDLLSYSRMTNRQVVHGPVELSELVAAASDNLYCLFQERGAKLECFTLATVIGDHVQLVELFQNLLGNAVKFTSPNTIPTIRIRAARENGMWHVSVADNGIGIAPEYHDRIFVIFQRLHTSAVFSGTGIGLAVCKRIVEQHGGRIWVESEEGRGATFHFTLAAV